MKNHGFTLIELLIVLVIISILASIAYPTLSHYIVRVRRAEAQTALLTLANRMEQYYIKNNNSYAAASLAKLKVSTKTAHGYYQLAIVISSQSSYLLQATPAFSDPTCGDLRFNQLGEKSISGSGTPTDCW